MSLFYNPTTRPVKTLLNLDIFSSFFLSSSTLRLIEFLVGLQPKNNVRRVACAALNCVAPAKTEITQPILLLLFSKSQSLMIRIWKRIPDREIVSFFLSFYGRGCWSGACSFRLQHGSIAHLLSYTQMDFWRNMLMARSTTRYVAKRGRAA